ncbi:hypothetical protein [Streptomyces sp. CB03911]|uniref:hypothetical protein n=1 Tax=Streptomycetaceae TaxID=2062 RepID=UPI0009397C19|nr:hypothetical protein [Streptomyces sp. CB03911]OKI12764.1 hypothetical protein A6A07_18105 [Streptomyces sp. CB03911]
MESTDDRTAAPIPAPGVAIYLRCYPFDRTAMDFHRRALEGLAWAMELPEPVLHLDNGLRAADGLPALDALLGAVAQGWVGTALVPGLFVFSMDDTEARRVADLLERHGCRVVELPSRGLLTRPAGAHEPPPAEDSGSCAPMATAA